MKCMVGLDSTDLSQEVFEVSCSFLRQPEIDVLYLVHVWQPTLVYNAYEYSSVLAVNRTVEQEARDLLIRFGHQCAHRKIKHKCLLVSGNPGSEICNLVKKYQIDVLILGCRQLGVVEKFILGSVSEYCLKNAHCSVLIHKKGSLDLLGSPQSHSHQVSGKDYLLNTTVMECMSRHKPLAHVESLDTASQIFRNLNLHSISAVPVRDSSSKNWLGFVDMTDIAQFVLDELQTIKTDEQLGELIQRNPLASIHANELLSKRIHPSKVFLSLMGDDNLHVVLEKFITQGLKRAGVNDKSGNLIGVLSELKLITFLSDRAYIFESSHKTIQDLQLGYREVVVVSERATVRSAIQSMIETNITGLGVVNEEGKLIGNISISDLKLVSTDQQLFQLFFLPVKEILSHQRQQLIPSPICVQPQATIEEVIEKFAITKVHRIYVVSEKEELLGIITPSDIIQLLFSVFITK